MTPHCSICGRPDGSASWIHEFNEETQFDTNKAVPLKVDVVTGYCQECHQLGEILRRIESVDGDGPFLPADTFLRYKDAY